jgi:glycyl-tRNA synthetase beta chain
VSAAFKRMKNILAQAQEKGLLSESVEAPSLVAMHPAQSALQSAAVDIAAEFKTLAEKHEYVSALELIAKLRAPVDTFFEQVMVMDEDPQVRGSRLRLLQSLVETFTKIADFSEIVTAG